MEKCIVDFKRFFILSSSLLIISLLFNCKKKVIEIRPAFYHWQTNFDLSQQERVYLEELTISKIYAKFFDIDWDFNKKKPIPLATINFDKDLPRHLEIIPTIFITNRTLLHIKEKDLSTLAKQIKDKLKDQTSVLPFSKIKEIQFDCDWTAKTQKQYFDLLDLLKTAFEKENIDLSATIRLHQIKFVQKTGVPPVSRGVLMYYNMGKLQDLKTQNSIIDNNIGAQYLDKLKDYPLALDIALPLFQWGVLFRNGKMIKLINQLEEANLENTEWFSAVQNNIWKVKKSTYLNGYYLYENDLIRLEKVSLQDLETATNLLSKRLKEENRNIIFYHLDQNIINGFRVEDLQKLILVFRKE